MMLVTSDPWLFVLTVVNENTSVEADEATHWEVFGTKMLLVGEDIEFC
jgi:hypothetical protein